MTLNCQRRSSIGSKAGCGPPWDHEKPFMPHTSGPGCSFLRRMGNHQKTHQRGDVAITELWVGQSGSHAGGRLKAAAVVTVERDGSGRKGGILKTGNQLDFIQSAESGHSPRARHCPPCLRCTSEEIRQNPASPTQNLCGGLVVSPRDATSEAALSSEPWAQSVVRVAAPGGHPWSCFPQGAAPGFVEQTHSLITQAGHSRFGGKQCSLLS